MATKRRKNSKQRLPIPPRRQRPVEGSKADVAQDKREAKKRGVSMKQWEASPEDKAMDAAAAPTPGPNEVSPTQETAMRQGARAARTPPASPYPDEDLD